MSGLCFETASLAIAVHALHALQAASTPAAGVQQAPAPLAAAALHAGMTCIPQRACGRGAGPCLLTAGVGWVALTFTADDALAAMFNEVDYQSKANVWTVAKDSDSSSFVASHSGTGCTLKYAILLNGMSTYTPVVSGASEDALNATSGA